MKRLYQTKFRRRIFISTLLILLSAILSSTWFYYNTKKHGIIENYAAKTLFEMPGLINETLSSGKFPPLSEWKNTFSTGSQSASITLCDQENNLVWSSITIEEKNDAQLDIDQVCHDFIYPMNSIKLLENFNGSAYVVQTVPWLATKYNPQGRVIFAMRVNNDAQELQQLKLTTVVILGFILLSASALLLFFYNISFSPLLRLEKELSAIRQGQQENLVQSYPEDLQSMTEALNELLFQQKENQQRYKTSLNDLAHSLKTRVAVSQALLNDDNHAKHEEINQQLMAMDDVIQGQLRRASFGVKGIADNQVALTPVITDLLSMFNKIHQDKGLKIEFSCTTDHTLAMNRSDIMEIMGNVLENSYRFAKEKIAITLQHTNNDLVIEITNDGPPIEAAIMETLFQRGVRADQQHPGTGLGLALCDEIVHSYKGAIWFDKPSCPNMNVSLKILLPCYIKEK